MKIIIECHGISRNWCGQQELTLDAQPGATLQAILDSLASEYPEFAAHRHRVAVAVGDTVLRANARLTDGDRLALIPPVSGG